MTSDDILDISLNLANNPTWLDLASGQSYNVIESMIPPKTGEFLNFTEPVLADFHPPGLRTPDDTIYADLVMTPISNDSLSFLRPPDQSGAIIKLSQFNERIAQHKANAKAYPLAVPPGLRICAETSEDIGNIPIVQAFQAASEFSDILEWITSVPTSTGSTTLDTACNQGPPEFENSYPGSNPSTTVSSSQDTLFQFSNAILLLLLSSYVQVIDLYTCILTRVCEVMHHIPNTSEFFQRSARFRINGIGTLKARLYVSFMVQAAVDDLRSIENIMGLPQEFCVSQNTISTKGIFSSSDSLRLLRLVLCHSGSGCENQSAASVVATLREKVQSLETLLRP